MLLQDTSEVGHKLSHCPGDLHVDGGRGVDQTRSNIAFNYAPLGVGECPITWEVSPSRSSRAYMAAETADDGIGLASRAIAAIDVVGIRGLLVKKGYQ
jgi:hypothetical protein